METRVKFNSLGRKNIIYVWNTAYDSDMQHYCQGGQYIGSMAREFDTLGDGTTQHTPETAVTTENMIDYLSSLAFFVLDEGQEHLAAIAQEWPIKEDRAKCTFAFSVKHSKKIDRYYSTQENKVSTAKNKRHDRRWELVPEWADGSLESAYRILVQDKEYLCGLVRFSLYLHLRGIGYDLTGGFGWIAGYGLGLTDNNRFHDYSASFRCVDFMVQSYREMEHAKKSFDCLKHNLKLNIPGEEVAEEVVEEVKETK